MTPSVNAAIRENDQDSVDQKAAGVHIFSNIIIPLTISNAIRHNMLIL